MDVVRYNTVVEEVISAFSGVNKGDIQEILRLVGREYQQAIKEGCNIKVDGLFKIVYTSKGKVFYKNAEEDLSKITQKVFKDINGRVDVQTVKAIILKYAQVLALNVEYGKDVSIKGVGYLIKQSDGTYKGRIAPTLEKPEVCEFTIMEGCTPKIRAISGENLRLRIELDF